MYQTDRLIIKEGCDLFFADDYRRFNLKTYTAENDSITFISANKNDIIKNFLSNDYSSYNSASNAIQFYALYAVCFLGVCDLLSVKKFMTLISKGSDLEGVLAEPNSDKIRSALKKYVNGGLIMRHLFEPGGEADNIALYLPTQNGLMVLKNALQKEGMKEIFAPIMPPFRLLGKAASTYVYLEIADTFRDREYYFKDGFFSTFIGGHLYMNSILDVGDTLLGFTDLFLGFKGNSNYTMADEENFINSRILLIEQFKYYAKGFAKTPKVIVTISSLRNLEVFLKNVLQRKNSESVLMDLYFTTEMAFRSDQDDKYMVVHSNDHGSYELTPVTSF